MENKNHALRDPVIFRLKRGRHYRQGEKYKVWPMYDIANAAEDEWCEVTHVLRSIEFGQMRVELQSEIRKAFSWNEPEVTQYGRFNVIDSVTQGREIRALIESGEVSGWDDPRLVTVKTLRRRGIQPQAFSELAKDVGCSKSQTNLDWDKIAAFNRKILDAEAKRFFCIIDPIEIVVKGAPAKEVELDLHPDKHKGGRQFLTHERFLIMPDDAKQLQSGKLYRLMDCCNFKKEGENFHYAKGGIEEYRKEGKKIIHWLPAEKKAELAKIEVVMPDNSKVQGLAEIGVKQLEIGDVLQLERFGFCRLDAKEKDRLVFWYSHH